MSLNLDCGEAFWTLVLAPQLGRKAQLVVNAMASNDQGLIMSQLRLVQQVAARGLNMRPSRPYGYSKVL